VLLAEQMGDGSDRQDIGIEVDDFGELGEPERVKFGESCCEVGSPCNRGSELTFDERFDTNWVGFEERSIDPRISNVLMDGRNTHRGREP
jgi:hypothetical protein